MYTHEFKFISKILVQDLNLKIINSDGAVQKNTRNVSWKVIISIYLKNSSINFFGKLNCIVKRQISCLKQEDLECRIYTTKRPMVQI